MDKDTKNDEAVPQTDDNHPPTQQNTPCDVPQATTANNNSSKNEGKLGEIVVVTTAILDKKWLPLKYNLWTQSVTICNTCGT